MFGRILAGLTIVNFVAFVSIATYLGGDAVNGYAENGRFYLAMHGRTREVSEGIFTYSKWHTYSVFISFAIAIAWSLLQRSREGKHA